MRRISLAALLIALAACEQKPEPPVEPPVAPAPAPEPIGPEAPIDSPAVIDTTGADSAAPAADTAA